MNTPIAYTVALCTHNHADRLKRTLDDLPRIRAPKNDWEFLVVDNGSCDDTPNILNNQPWPKAWQVRVVREEKLGLSSARNRAISEARGEYIIFMDDDETADPHWLCAFERLIETKRPDAFGGPIHVLFEDERPRWLKNELLGFLGELNRSKTIIPLTDKGSSFNGGNFGFLRSICLRVGRFDEQLGRKGMINSGGEEVDFYLRLLHAGFRIWWTPEAIIYHRIQAAKLNRLYFLDLHYCQGRIQGARARGNQPKLPPRYLYPQALRAYVKALRKRLVEGSDYSLRLEMNAAYFTGYLLGWLKDSV